MTADVAEHTGHTPKGTPMLDIPTPTTSTVAHESGGTMQITEWTVGAYTLRKFVEPDYTGWAVLAVDRNLPRIQDNSPDRTPEFGVSCYSNGVMNPAGAAAYAGQIMEAAEIASTFNEIVANNY